MNWLAAILLLCNWLAFANGSIENWHTNVNVNALRLRPTPRFGGVPPPQKIRGEHIPEHFYVAAQTAEDSKQVLQNQLRNFLENLQRNLSTSTVLSSSLDNAIDTDIDVRSNTQHQLTKLHELSAFFHTASEAAGTFAHDSEQFYEVAKNASYALLLKLRQVPTAQPTQVKMLLTNYFAEMEFFHIMFSEIVDEALEYTQNTLTAIQKNFILYADTQRYVLQDWNFKPDVTCCIRYMEFLQYYSAQIFKCASRHELNVAYDVFAMTEMYSKHIMRQLEFRIQRLFNCFLFGNYEIRCRFLQNAEQDFEKLFSKLEELDSYYDIKTKRGRVSALRFRRRRQIEEEVAGAVETPPKNSLQCIPTDFPQAQMSQSLRSCFYFIGAN